MNQRRKLLVPITPFKPDLDEVIMGVFNRRFWAAEAVPATVI